MLTRKTRFLISLLMVGIGILLFALHVQPIYYLSAVAIFRNEAAFLPEWIEYHRLRGVEHFYLFNHLSEDNYLEVLKPYLKEGIVELYDWPYKSRDQKTWNKIQCGAYTKVLKEKKFETFWLAIIDTDEFLVPLQTSNLRAFLRPYELYGGVTINWQLFGTSNVERIPEGKTLIGSLVRRAPTNFSTNHFVKSIVQPRKVKKISQPHYCSYIPPFHHVTPDFEQAPSKSLTKTVAIEKIRIHHYTYRDEAFFYGEKRKRFLEWHPDQTPPAHALNYNEVEDLTLKPFVQEVEKAVEKRR